MKKIEIECGTQRQGDKRSAPQGYLLRGTAADLIASHAPLRARRKSPWGKHVGTKHVRFTVNINSRGFKGAANRGPAKAQRSGFGGERRSSGTTELLPRKAKRRMWSLRRRGTPFSSIFRRATKDRVPEGRWMTQMYEKSAATFVTAPIFTSKFPSTFAIPAPRTLSAPAYGRYPVAPKPPPVPPLPHRWPRPGSF